MPGPGLTLSQAVPASGVFRVLVGRLKRGATEQSMIIRGLRGVGKTVLLNAFEDRAESEGFITYYHELTPDSSLIAQIARDAQSALARLKLSARATKRIRGALDQLATIRLTGPEGFGLTVDLRAADEGTIADDLSGFFLTVGAAAAQKNSGVVFLLDEVQFAQEVEYRSLISALHRATQKNVPVTAAAAGLPQIPRLTGEARSYAERLFTFPADRRPGGGRRARSACGACAPPTRRVRAERGRVGARVDSRLPLSTSSNPLKHAWNLAIASPITTGDVQAALPAAQQALDASIYEVRIQRATREERRYMRAMAELGEGPYRSGQVAAKLGVAGQVSFRLARQRLIDKGLAYATEDYGHIDFTVPRFDEFMRRHMPYRSPGTSRRKPAG